MRSILVCGQSQTPTLHDISQDIYPTNAVGEPMLPMMSLKVIHLNSKVIEERS